MVVPCIACQLRQKPVFQPFSQADIEFLTGLKSAHVAVAQRTDILQAGQVGGSIATLFGGWAFRYKMLPKGKRQILDFLLPGDLIGLDFVVFGNIDHSVQSMTPVSLCILEGRPFHELFESRPELTVLLVRTLLEDRRRMDDRIALLGQCRGPERLGYIMLETFERLRQRGMANATWCPFPVQRQQLADALGLSRTHLIRSLAELQRRNLATISNHTLVIHDQERLAALSGYRQPDRSERRLLL